MTVEAGTSAEVSKPTAEVGILLVHGIGNQIRGETLVGFGEPIYKTLKERIESGEDPSQIFIPGFRTRPEGLPPERSDKVNLVEGFLSPLESQLLRKAEPPHVRFAIKSEDSRGDAVEWVMAECHWANSFPPPTSQTVTLWIMNILPWIFTSFFVRRLRMTPPAIVAALRRAPRNWVDAIQHSGALIIYGLAVPLLCPLVFFAELAVGALLLLDLVPLKAVQNVVQRINAAISAILGDCFIFASSDFRQQSVVSKLLSDLAWIETKFGCKRIVVVAHSQGAAIAYLALQKCRPASVRLFITLGSGIVKLFELSNRDRKGEIDLIAFCFGAYVFFESFALSFLFGLNPVAPGEVSWTVAIMYGLLAQLFLLFPLIAVWRESTKAIREQALEFDQAQMRWFDFYASMDPVPNGPVLIPGTKSLETIRLCNQSSIIADHTSYTTNRDEFLPLVVDTIVQHSGTSLNVPCLDRAARFWAQGLRRIHVLFKRIDKAIVLAALIAFLYDHEIVDSVGGSVTRWITDACSVAGGMETCWKFSATTTGVFVALAGYVVLRMLIEGLNSDGPMIARTISPLVACSTLVAVVLLYYPEPFAWASWIYSHMRIYSPKLIEGFVFALPAWVLLTKLRLSLLRRLGKELKQDAIAEVTTATHGKDGRTW